MMQTNIRRAWVHVPAKELKAVLARALNCMEPNKIPKWALDLSDEVQDDDTITVSVERNTPVEVKAPNADSPNPKDEPAQPLER